MKTHDDKMRAEIRRIADRLKTYRIARNLTQERLGELLGYHETTIGRMESGRSELTITKAMDLAGYYEMTLDELVGFSYDNEPVSPAVMEPVDKWVNSAKARPSSVVFQFGEGENSPRTERFLKRLGKLLQETASDED